MGRFRSQVRLGSWSALFAFALQFALSFGHLHLSGHATLAAAAPLIVLRAGQAPTDSPALPAAPSHQTDDSCAICSVTQLTGSSVPAASPALPLPAYFTPAQFETTSQLPLAPVRHLVPQARAPPLT
jgi:hypothetical protein